MSAASVQESLGVNAGDKTKTRSGSKCASGAGRTQRNVQLKEPCSLPSSTAFSLDQQHANCVASLADQMVITTATNEKTSLPSGGCAGDVTIEYTLRSARKRVSKLKQKKRGKLWNTIKNRTEGSSQSLRGICSISLLILSGCVMYLRLSISSKGRREP